MLEHTEPDGPAGPGEHLLEPGSAERVARNEATSRQVNEAIERGLRSSEGLVGFICECGQLGCNDVLELTVPEYEHVRSDARRFIVREGHDAEVDEVMQRYERFVLVEKREGRAREIAEQTDPRA